QRRDHRRLKSEWLDCCDCWIVQRDTKRRRSDAAPRTGVRARARQRRWPRHPSVGGLCVHVGWRRRQRAGGSMTNTLDRDTIERHGITPEEYARIVSALGRDPNLTELGIFSVMWSEHCSYKSSRLHLKTLPTDGPQVLQGPGENAG